MLLGNYPCSIPSIVLHRMEYVQFPQVGLPPSRHVHVCMYVHCMYVCMYVCMRTMGNWYMMASTIKCRWSNHDSRYYPVNLKCIYICTYICSGTKHPY